MLVRRPELEEVEANGMELRFHISNRFDGGGGIRGARSGSQNGA
jgi:hypothetical protein